MAKKEKTAEQKFWNRWKCKNILSFSNMVEYSQSRGNLNRCDGLFLLNEHGDLYFLLHKNIVHTILLNLEKKFKNLSEGKKDIAKSVRKTVTPNMQIMTTKTTTLQTLYVHVVLNCVICPQILNDIVLYAPHFLPVTFSPKCSFNKVCFELLQNLTWTDE